MSESHITAYAQSLFQIATAEQAGEQFTRELHQVVDAIGSHQELHDVVNNVGIPVGRRQQVLEDVLGGRVAPVTLSLINLVAANGRIDQLDEIARAVSSLGAERRGERLAEVRSAVPLTEEQKAKLATALAAKLNTNVSIRNIIDPSVMGGFVVEVDDTLIDGSVRTRLNQLREAF